MAAPTGEIWKSVAYGHSPVYWMTIAGIPGVFTQRVLGLTLPTSFNTFEDASLSLVGCAPIGVGQIDRDTGLGCGLSLGFTLLDSTTVRDWMRKWTRSATLTATLQPTENTTMTVDSTTGWPASGYLYQGLECISYSSTDATHFKGGLFRAQAGTFPNRHMVGTTGQVITDRPRSYIGREVHMYACFADPSGFVAAAGTALADVSLEVWRGRIVQGPARKIAGFAFEADSLDRLLDVGLAPAITGKVASTFDAVYTHADWRATVEMTAHDTTGTQLWSYQIPIMPFTNGYITTAAARALIVSAWDAAVTAAGAGSDLGAWAWHESSPPGYQSASVAIPYEATLEYVYSVVTIEKGDGTTVTTPAKVTWYKGGMTGTSDCEIGWNTSDPTTYAVPQDPMETYGESITVGNLSGSPADVGTDEGRVRVKAGSAECVYRYASAIATGDQVQLQFTTPIAGQTPLAPAQMANAEAEILTEDTGTWKELMLRCLHSSGCWHLQDGTYDALGRGQGYGLPTAAVDQTSFAMLDDIPFEGAVSSSGSSFQEMFGGLLGLSRMAVVCQPMRSIAGTPVQLQLVRSAGGAAQPAGTLDDTMLLAHAGDPVESVDPAPGPTAVRVESSSSESGPKSTFRWNDNIGGDERGRVEVTYRVDVPDADVDKLRAWSKECAQSLFAFEGTVQAVSLLVSPTFLLQTGEVILLDSDHPSLWTYTSNPGALGYTGAARITGRAVDPSTSKLSIKLLVDGGAWGGTLCPSMPVVTYDDPTNPTQITVDAKYATVLAAMAAAGLPIVLLEYVPGDAEDALHPVTITSVSGSTLYRTALGALTRDLTAYSHLTFQETALASTFQKLYAHALDGSAWGV